MIEKNTARVLIGAMNLVAVTSPMLTIQGAQAKSVDQKIAKVNAASLKSMESTWLKVPTACKARGFNANPVSLDNKEIAFHIQDIYAAFGV